MGFKYYDIKTVRSAYNLLLEHYPSECKEWIYVYSDRNIENDVGRKIIARINFTLGYFLIEKNFVNSLDEAINLLSDIEILFCSQHNIRLFGTVPVIDSEEE